MEKWGCSPARAPKENLAYCILDAQILACVFITTLLMEKVGCILAMFSEHEYSVR